MNGEPRWALDGRLLPVAFKLELLLQLERSQVIPFLASLPAGAAGETLPPPLAPIENTQEVWASGVTYLRSRDARTSESQVADVYERVYEAARPELFFKALGWRVVGDGMPVRHRRDSDWNVPEPELCLVLNSRTEITGYCVGNDMSSRSIEGENPLYLPQAKTYNGSCALGPGIQLVTEDPSELPITLTITRGREAVFEGQVSTSQIKRPLTDLTEHLARELDFPGGVFLMTGTGIVPPEHFSLEPGDSVEITVGSLTLTNTVTS
ncbi:MAG: fumarylacetoacetate hydrolase family protein [Trueperaceae bacterium]|nr:MAG: fumarylacetoacetate hydrolase family protein [Trueperaceae bacterium]